MLFDAVRMALNMKALEHGTNLIRMEIPLRSVDWSIDEVEPASDLGILDLRVEYSKDSIVCTGTLEASFETPCARCLEPASFRCSAGISRVYSSDTAVLEGEEDIDPILAEDDRLVILDAIREAVILSVPCKPLCRPDCPGICYN